MRKLLLIVLFLTICCGCTVAGKNNNLKIHSLNDEAITKAKARERIEDNSRVIQNKDDVLYFAEDTYYVYFSKEDCPFCEMLEPIINHYVAYYNDPPIYFVDGSMCTSLGIFESSESIESSYTLAGVPSLLLIENHRILNSFTGTEPINGELKSSAFNVK